MNQTYDVIAVSLADRSVRLIAHDKDARNSEAIIDAAVVRRGVKDEFFTTAPHLTYRDGDKWRGA